MEARRMICPSDCCQCQCHTISSERIQHGDSLTQTPFYCGRGQVIINGMGHMRKFHIKGTAAVGRCAMSRNGIKLVAYKTDRSTRACETHPRSKKGEVPRAEEGTRNGTKLRRRTQNQAQNRTESGSRLLAATSRPQ